MLEGLFNEQEKIHIEPLSEDAKAAVEDARLILNLKGESDKLVRFETFVRFAQEDSARARNYSDESEIAIAKRSTSIRFGLLGLSEETSEILTNAIYAR